jgi:hypothetical protein
MVCCMWWVPRSCWLYSPSFSHLPLLILAHSCLETKSSFIVWLSTLPDGSCPAYPSDLLFGYAELLSLTNIPGSWDFVHGIPADGCTLCFSLNTPHLSHPWRLNQVSHPPERLQLSLTRRREVLMHASRTSLSLHLPQCKPCFWIHLSPPAACEPLSVSLATSTVYLMSS